MRVIIFGASGMIGKGVLLECLDDEAVDKVLVVGRSSPGIDHPKVEELSHGDFTDFAPVADKLTGFDACFFCLGVSSGGMNETQYARITEGFTMAAAEVLLEHNPEMVFIYVSGAGADSTEKGRSMWARVKGRVENRLLAMGFRDAYMFRPGLIRPMRGVVSKTPAYRAMYTLVGWALPLVRKMAPHAMTTTTNIGRAMLHLATHGHDHKILNDRAINALAERANA